MTPIGIDERFRRLRAMRFLRTFEAALLRQSKPGFQLLSRGEEAVAVGICAALEPRDQLLCSGRSIGPALARGVPPAGMLAELLGKDGGPNRGRAGRGHISMPSIGFFGAHAVVGGNLTVAAGVALAQQQLSTGAIVLCLFGDGACGTGALHETMNLAALWKLPLVLVCSNNGYAVSTPVERALAPRRLTDLAAPFGIPAEQVDGSDVDLVADAVGKAVAAARAALGPAFVEIQCARLATHSTLTPEKRPPELMALLKVRDPIAVYQHRLVVDGVLNDALAASMQAEVDADIAEAEHLVAAAPWPDGNEALTDV